MKEIKSIIKAYQQIDFAQTRASLATVVRVEGSSYRRTGARMLVLDNGTYLGGISGGCLEGDALRRAQKAIAQRQSSIVTYDTTKDDGHQIGVGLGCNGIIDVLFTPLEAEDKENPVEILSNLAQTRSPRVLVTITVAAKNLMGKTTVFENDTQFLNQFPIPNLAQEVLENIKNVFQKEKSTNFTYNDDQIRIFVEYLVPNTNLIIFGGNYDVLAMVQLARALDWNVTVVMNIHKADKAISKLGANIWHNKQETLPTIDAHTALILMAHDYKTDLENLKKVLNTPAKYIGLLGPKKRSEKMFKEIEEVGDWKLEVGLPDFGSRISDFGQSEQQLNEQSKFDDFGSRISDFGQSEQQLNEQSKFDDFGSRISDFGQSEQQLNEQSKFANQELSEIRNPKSEIVKLSEIRNPKSEIASRLFAPAGLDIGAQTPEEIALSIIAEIKTAFTGRNGHSLKWREGTIY